MGFQLANVDGRAALLHDDGLYDLEHLGAPFVDPMEALAHPDLLHQLGATLSDREPTARVADVVLGPPVPRPQKVFGIGLNYQAHADEASIDPPENPLVFTKFPSCLVGPTADVEIRSDGCDYEAELVVVIGTSGRDIPIERAWDHIVGVTVGQDISDRPAQFAAKPPHFDLGKSFDTFGPIGPAVVSLDLIGDRDAIPLGCEVNGEERQRASTAGLIFDVPTLVSYLSSITTLVPGDLIFTGTPEGVGMASGRFLVDGDVITTSIDGVGTMTNRVVRIDDARPVRG